MTMNRDENCDFRKNRIKGIVFIKAFSRSGEDSGTAARITAETIRAIYPQYYPIGAVKFLVELYSEIEIYLVVVQGGIVRT